MKIKIALCLYGHGMRMKGYNNMIKYWTTMIVAFSQWDYSKSITWEYKRYWTKMNFNENERLQQGNKARKNNKEDREVTTGDDREKKSSVNRMVNLRDFLYSVPCLNSHLFCEWKVNGISPFGEQPGAFINLINLSENYTSCI